MSKQRRSTSQCWRQCCPLKRVLRARNQIQRRALQNTDYWARKSQWTTAANSDPPCPNTTNPSLQLSPILPMRSVSSVSFWLSFCTGYCFSVLLLWTADKKDPVLIDNGLSPASAWCEEEFISKEKEYLLSLQCWILCQIEGTILRRMVFGTIISRKKPKECLPTSSTECCTWQKA